jgi:hypothetical protein
MIKLTAAAMGGLFAISLALCNARAAEPDWRDWFTICKDQIDQDCASKGYANCGGWWDKKARCIIAHTWPGQLYSPKSEMCIAQIQQARLRAQVCNNCPDPVTNRDPVTDSLMCYTRKG